DREDDLGLPQPRLRHRLHPRIGGPRNGGRAASVEAGEDPRPAVPQPTPDGSTHIARRDDGDPRRHDLPPAMRPEPIAARGPWPSAAEANRRGWEPGLTPAARQATDTPCGRFSFFFLSSVSPLAPPIRMRRNGPASPPSTRTASSIRP